MVKLEQQSVVINEGNVKKQCSKVPNWKAPRHDGVQWFQIKRLDKMHEQIATQLNEILERTKEIPSWMTYGRAMLYQKDPVKGNSVENFRVITCLPLMWKLLTGINSEDIYCFMENENLLPEQQKGCRRKSRGTRDQLLIYKTTLKNVKKEEQILLWRGQIIETPMILSHIAGFQSVLTCLALLITSEVFWSKARKNGNFF